MIEPSHVFSSVMIPDWGFFLLAALVLVQLVVTIFVFVLYRRRAVVGAVPRATPGAATPEGNDLTPINGSANGFAMRDDLKRLHKHLGIEGRKSPLFLVLGDSLPGSVSTVFEGQDGSYLEGTQLEFHFFARGVLIVPKPHLSAVGRAENGIYDLLFRELLNRRPSRPLDGVVLSISVETLRNTGENAEETDRTAFRLHEQLLRLQQATGMRLPVHLLFYDSEKLCGFNEFGRGVSKHHAKTPGSLDCVEGESLSWSPTSHTNLEWDSRFPDMIQKSFFAEILHSRILAFADIRETTAQESQNLFLLASELEELGPRFGQLCNILFTQGVYHEPFVFRGVAFGGTITDRRKESRFVGASNLLRNGLYENAIHAVPVRRIFQTRKRTVRIVQAASLLLLTVWGCGMYWTLPGLKQDVASAIRFGKNWDQVYSDDQKMGDLLNSKTFVTNGVRAPRNDTLWEIFHATNSDENDDLCSVFYPGSFLSPLPYRVFRWHHEFYDDFVNVSMPLAMEWKTREIYCVPSENVKTTDQVNERFIVPQMTLEYAILSKHIEASKEYTQMNGKYESFLKKGDLETFLELTHYLWNTQDTLTPEHVRAEKLDMETLIDQVVRERNDAMRLNPEKEIERKKNEQKKKQELVNKARIKFAMLAKQFDERIYTNDPLLLSLERIEKTLNDTLSFQSTPLTQEKTERFWTEINQAVAALKDERFQWILSEKPLFDDTNLPLRKTVREETLLGDWDIEQWDEHSAELKGEQFQRLKKLSYRRSDDFQSYFFSPDGLNALTPSAWMESLCLLLDQLRHEPFVSQAGKANVVPLAGNPLSVEWDAVILHDALQSVDRFNKIFAESDRSFPLIKIKAGQQLIDHVHKHVADSRRIRRRANESQLVYGNFAEVAPKIVQILDVYRSFQTDARRQYEELASVADQQAFAFLAEYDRFFVRDRLYVPQDISTKWNGNGSLLVPLLGIGSEGEIETYLKIRRERLKYWETKIDPILVYLQSRADLTPTLENQERTDRWTCIQDGIELNDTSAPDDPLTALEQFVKIGLSQPDREPLSPSSNWFYQKMYELDVAARNGSNRREEFDFQARWKKAAEFFNKNLNGRFPFVNENFVQAPSASPDAIRAFYSLLPEIPNPVKFGGDWVTPPDYVRFHEIMTATRPLFFGKLQGPNTIPDLVVSAKFRVPDPTECGCQRLLDQSLRLGTTEMSLRNGVNKAAWQFGSPVRFTLHWAKDGGVIPIAVPENRNGKIQGNKRSFDYDSPWSLLVFLYENQQIMLEQDAAGEDQVICELGFDIPTMPGGTQPMVAEDTDRLRTFVRIRLHTLEGEDGAMEIVLPRQFPAWMPTEDQKRWEEKKIAAPPTTGPVAPLRDGVREWNITPPVPQQDEIFEFFLPENISQPLEFQNSQPAQPHIPRVTPLHIEQQYPAPSLAPPAPK